MIVIGRVRRGPTAKFVSEAFIQIADSDDNVAALGIYLSIVWLVR